MPPSDKKQFSELTEDEQKDIELKMRRANLAINDPTAKYKDAKEFYEKAQGGPIDSSGKTYKDEKNEKNAKEAREEHLKNNPTDSSTGYDIPKTTHLSGSEAYGEEDAANAQLQDYNWQGGNKWNTVEKTDEDKETERISRIADRLNNRVHYAGNIATASGDGNVSIQGGEPYQAPKIENEDTRQQDLRRSYESERRTWNTGLKQAGTQYEQDMELVKVMRENINKILMGAQNIELINKIQNPQLRGMMYGFMQMSMDQRGLVRKATDWLFQGFEDYFTGRKKDDP